MVRIFLAHAKEDKAQVFELYDRLKKHGYQPWLDKKDLLAGQLWRAEIPKAIKNSDIFIACLSQQSVKKKGYIQREFKMALNEMADRPPGQIYLVPVRLDNCEIPELRQEEYGINLRDYQWIDLFESDGFEQLMKSVAHHFPGNTSQLSSDSTVIPEIPPVTLQTPIPKEPLKETKQREEKVVIIQEGSKYDLRGAQFAGGFAETVLGNQVGGMVRNELSEPAAKEAPPATTNPQIIDLGDGVLLKTVHIPGGVFWMGSPEHEPNRKDDEGPQKKVKISTFWMGMYPVTQRQWRAVSFLDDVDKHIEPDPAHFKGNDLPIERVSWHDAVEFCKRLSRHTGKQYRLPSEAEWEYACRARMETPFCFGKSLTKKTKLTFPFSSKLANYKRTKTTPVGTYSPNDFGLYDMHGNIWEWCQDYWHKNYEGVPIDGSAWIEGGDSSFRMIRGGSWYNSYWSCRSATRNASNPNDRENDVGFRVVCLP